VSQPFAQRPSQRIVIRASSLNGFADCARRWAANLLRVEIRRAGYVLRDDPRGIGAAVGSSIHESARVTLEEKAATGLLPPARVATDIAAETIKEQIRYGVIFDEKVTPNPDDALAQAVRMALSYHHAVAPQIEPIVVEQRLEAEIPWSENGLIVSGQPDTVAREPNTVVDLKGGARLGWHHPQIGSYGLLAITNKIADVERARIDWVPRTTMNKPQPPPVAHRVDIEQATRIATNVLKHADIAISTFRRGDEQRGLDPGDPAAFVSNPGSMLCNPKYCAAHSCGPNGWCQDYEVK
jgi:hypothetical protein